MFYAYIILMNKLISKSELNFVAGSRGMSSQRIIKDLRKSGYGEKANGEILYLDDLGYATLFSLENWNPTSENSPNEQYGIRLNNLNIGTGKDISIKQLAKKIPEFYEFKDEILWGKAKPDGTPKIQLDISKIIKLGWGPKISLDAVIKETKSIYQNLMKINSESKN